MGHVEKGPLNTKSMYVILHSHSRFKILWGHISMEEEINSSYIINSSCIRELPDNKMQGNDMPLSKNSLLAQFCLRYF